VGAVHGEVVFYEGGEQFPLFAGPRMLRAPEEAMVHHQQVGPGIGGEAHGG